MPIDEIDIDRSKDNLVLGPFDLDLKDNLVKIQIDCHITFRDVELNKQEVIILRKYLQDMEKKMK